MNCLASLRVYLACILSVSLPITALAETRVFTDLTGRTIRGELVAINGDMVTIKRDDGQTFTVKSSTFCAADLSYFLQHVSQPKSATSVETASKAKSDGNSNTIECKDFVLSGTGFTIEHLDNDIVAYSNRAYKWEKVPSAVRGLRYTKINGGGKPKMKVIAKHDILLQAFTDITTGGSLLDGWDKTSLRFTTDNNLNHTNMTVLTRRIEAGKELEIEQGNFAGVLILLPKE